MTYQPGEAVFSDVPVDIELVYHPTIQHRLGRERQRRRSHDRRRPGVEFRPERIMRSTRVTVAVIIFVTVASGGWGPRGHTVANRAAVDAIPAGGPVFLKE